MTISQIQNEIIDEFSMFDDWMQRYEYIIELGKTLPVIAEKYKTDDNLIKGCQSKVWLHAQEKDSLICFTADSDAILTKGIIAILIRVFNDQKAKDILEANTDFIDKIGLTEKMSHMNKSTDIENAKFKFGDEVRDKLTKFKGVVGSICVSMNGDISVGLSQEYNNMAKDTSMWWFDEGRVELVKSAKIALTTPKEDIKKEEKPKRTGGIATRPEGVYR